jgi:hypothetical protein
VELDPVKDSMSLAGSRCVLVKYSHLRNHFVLDLRDFNPYRVRVRARRARNSNNSNNNSKAATTAGITTLAVLSADACFEEDVVSELPFVSIRKENVGSRVFLDDEWMAEILVRSVLPAFGKSVASCLRMPVFVTDSGIENSERRSSSSVPLRLPRKSALDRMACDMTVPPSSISAEYK